MPQRSPIIVALFLAANLCADLVACNWMQVGSGANYSDVAYFALLSAQLSAVCIWAGLRPGFNWWSAILPIAAAVAVSFAYGVADRRREFDFLPYFLLQASLLLTGLWIFKRTRYWRQRSGTKSDWQFSVAHLLALMTIVAVLTPLLRASPLFDDDTVILIVAFLGCTVAVAIMAPFIWSLHVNWLFRFAGVLMTALSLSAIFYLGDQWDNYHMFPFALYHLLTQGVVIAASLAWGGILPRRDKTDTGQT
jgi:hypothetical protein